MQEGWQFSCQGNHTCPCAPTHTHHLEHMIDILSFISTHFAMSVYLMTDANNTHTYIPIQHYIHKRTGIQVHTDSLSLLIQIFQHTFSLSLSSHTISNVLLFRDLTFHFARTGLCTSIGQSFTVTYGCRLILLT